MLPKGITLYLVVLGSLMTLPQTCHVSAANILASALYGEGSHFLAMSTIAQVLVRHGHNVTFLISNANVHRVEDPKYSNFSFEIFTHPVPLEVVQEKMEAMGRLAFANQDAQAFELIKSLTKRLVEDCEAVLTNKEMISRMTKMEVILMDINWNCAFYLREVINKAREQPKDMTMIAFTPALPWSGFIKSSGSPFNYAYQPEVTSGLPSKMTFLQRLKNVAITLSFSVMSGMFSGYNKDMEKRLGLENSFDMIKSYSDFDLFLTSVDFGSDFIMPLGPNVIPVGGLTASMPTPLNTELEDFLQSSGDHGVIVFTLGTYLASITTFRPEIVVMFAEAFRRLPQKVIWQLKELPEDYELPPNVKTMPWLPQNDLLGHPKTRAFMYQGGNNGFQEACYHGVPIVVIPLQGDQYDVAARIEARGLGKKIDKQSLATDLVYETLSEVINNPMYTNVAKKVSAIYQDQPMSAADRAAFWIEHVIKFGGSYMRSPANDLNFIQYHLLDVYAFLTSVVIVLMAVVYYLLRCCLSMCCRLVGRGSRAKAKKE